jgi:hypothetical protein
MVILEFYFDDVRNGLYVEFSSKEDGDKFYRSVELSYSDIKFYSPVIISEEDLRNIDDEFIKDLLLEYFKENDLPEEKSL